MQAEKTYFEQALDLASTGMPFVTVTFIASQGSAPQDAGSKMIVTREGLVWGTIGGGRVEARSIEEAQAMLGHAGAAVSPEPIAVQLRDWDLGRDLGMTCGGSVMLFFESRSEAKRPAVDQPDGSVGRKEDISRIMESKQTYFEQAIELSAAGTPFVTVTFLDSRGSAPQDAGSKMIVTGEGLHWGTVGGGGLEGRAIEEARALLAEALRTGAPNVRPTKRVDWDLERDLGKCCGGSVMLYFEAFNTNVWNVAVFGAGHVSQALVPILLTFGCRVTVVDARPEWLERLPRSTNLRPVVAEQPSSHVADLPERTFVLSLTPGHQHDLEVMRAAFRSGRPFPYLGVIGSKRKAGELRKGLLEDGVSEKEIERIHCPVGLPIGTNAPPEIAVSIAAELLQERDRLQK